MRTYQLETEEQSVERQYKQMLADLRSVIELNGDLKQFVTRQKARKAAGEDVHTFEVKNLYRVFSKDNPQRMSLELYVRLCQTVGKGGARMQAMKVPTSNLSLIDFLLIDTDIVQRTFTQFQYHNPNHITAGEVANAAPAKAPTRKNAAKK